MIKDDRAFRLLHQEIPEIFVLCIPKLSTCCQNLEKNLGSPEKFGRRRGLSFKGSDREKCQF